MGYYHNSQNLDSRIVQLLEKITIDGVRVIDNFWQNLIIQGSGSFLGAFFAFLFGGLAFYIKKN